MAYPGCTNLRHITFKSDRFIVKFHFVEFEQKYHITKKFLIRNHSDAHKALKSAIAWRNKIERRLPKLRTVAYQLKNYTAYERKRRNSSTGILGIHHSTRKSQTGRKDRKRCSYVATWKEITSQNNLSTKRKEFFYYPDISGAREIALEKAMNHRLAMLVKHDIDANRDSPPPPVKYNGVTLYSFDQLLTLIMDM